MVAFRSRLAVFVSLAMLLLAALAVPTAAQEVPSGTEVGGVTIVSPDEPYAGVSRGEWDARSWQWSVSLPLEINPSFDPGGEACGYGQFGPVFFLPGNYTGEPITMTCVVPEGTAIFVGVGGAECSTVEPPPFFGRDEAEMRACAAEATDGITDVQLSINGEDVSDLESYRTSSPLFTMSFPGGNYFEVPPGVALSVSDGYNVIIAPPPVGEYDIAVAATFPDGTSFTNTAHIIVEAPQVIEPGATPGA